MSLKQKIGAGMVFGALALGSAQTRADVVAHWAFEEGGGTIAYDSSGYGNHGTVFGGAEFVEGKIGSGLSLDGTDDFVRVPYSQSLGELPEVTLEAWVRRNSLSDGMIISKNGPYYLSIRDNRVEGGIFAGDPPTWQEVRGETALETNRWYHVAMSYDNSFVRVFLNDIENGSVPKTGSICITGQDLYLGFGEPGHNQFFNGVIDEARVHNEAIPEPSTLMLLAGSSLVAFRKRQGYNRS
jgi:hypothetical protein